MTRWITSDELAAVSLGHHDAGTGLEGSSLGLSQRGGPFIFDPFTAYRAGLVASPNILVTGAIGTGKSTVVKMLVTRALRQGQRVVVLDPKGEYLDLAEAWRGEVLRPGDPDSTWRSSFSGDEHDDLALVSSIIATALERSLSDEERYVLDTHWSLRDRRCEPLSALYQRAQADVVHASSPERTIALVLRRLVDGDLAGLFNGAAAKSSSSLVVVDLSRAWTSDHFALIGLAAMAVARATLESGSGPGYLVVDEAWAVLVDPRVAHWLQGSWKLARARGLSHVLVLHRWSDAFAVADEPTAQRARVIGILRDCDTTVLMRQDPGEQALLRDVIGLRDIEFAHATELPRGVGLVRYGKHRSIVRFEPDADDRVVIDTDQAMRETT